MPAKILRLQERAAVADAVPRQEAIRQRVTAILPLYRLSRYRPSALFRQVPVEPATDERTRPPDTSIIARAAPRRGTVADAATAPASGERAHQPSTDPTAEDQPDVGRRGPGDAQALEQQLRGRAW